jgi:hypothetical protein
MEGAVRIQGNYQKGVELGLDSGNEPTVAGMVAVEYMMKSYQTYEYKIPFDEALVSGNYDAISHDVITINHEEPTIAVCSLLSIDRMFRNGDWVRVALNVVPLSTTESVAVFSYLTQDADLARTALHRLVTAEGFYQKYLLSKLILNNCENFVVSPAYYDRWTPEKKKAINEYFIETLTEGNLDVEDQNLYLF